MSFQPEKEKNAQPQNLKDNHFMLISKPVQNKKKLINLRNLSGIVYFLVRLKNYFYPN